MSNSWTSPSGDDGRPPEQPAYGQNPPPQYGQNPPPQYGQPAYGQQPPYPAQPGQYPAAPPVTGPYGGPPQGPYGGWAPFAVKPGVIPLRALTLGDIFEGSLRTIRGNPGATLGLSFIVSLIFTLPAIAVILGVNQVDVGDSDTARELVSSLSNTGTSLLQAVGGIALAGMLTVVLADAVLGRRMSIGAAWSRCKGRILALVGLNLLMFLALALLIGGVALIGVLLVVFVNEVAGVIVLIIGLIGAVLATIFLWIKWSFASACVVLERQSPVAALKRSWALTRGQWWRVFGITLLAGLLASMIAGVVMVPASIILLLTTGMADDPDALPSIGFLIGTQLMSMLVATITAPFSAGVTGLLYLDQRIRKEALDVTLISASQQQSG